MVNGRRHDSSFKSKVALEAIKGEFSVNELASMYSIHPNQIIRWKKQALECLPDVFEKGGGSRIATLSMAHQLMTAARKRWRRTPLL